MLASGVVSWGVALVMVFSIAETTDSVSWSAGKHVAFMGEFLEPTECDSPADGSLVANESRWPDPLRTNALMVASRCKPSPKWVIIHLPATTIRRSITIAVTSCAHLALLMMVEATRKTARRGSAHRSLFPERCRYRITSLQATSGCSSQRSARCPQQEQS